MLWNTWKFIFYLVGQQNIVCNIFVVAVSGRTEAKCHEGQQTGPVHQVTITQTQNILFGESVELGYRINCLWFWSLPQSPNVKVGHAVAVNNLTNSTETMGHNFKFNPSKHNGKYVYRLLYYFKKFSILSTSRLLLFSYNSKKNCFPQDCNLTGIYIQYSVCSLWGMNVILNVIQLFESRLLLYVPQNH